MISQIFHSKNTSSKIYESLIISLIPLVIYKFINERQYLLFILILIGIIVLRKIEGKTYIKEHLLLYLLLPKIEIYQFIISYLLVLFIKIKSKKDINFVLYTVLISFIINTLITKQIPQFYTDKYYFYISIISFIYLILKRAIKFKILLYYMLLITIYYSIFHLKDNSLTLVIPNIVKNTNLLYILYILSDMKETPITTSGQILYTNIFFILTIFFINDSYLSIIMIILTLFLEKISVLLDYIRNNKDNTFRFSTICTLLTTFLILIIN